MRGFFPFGKLRVRMTPFFSATRKLVGVIDAAALGREKLLAQRMDEVSRIKISQTKAAKRR
jgi:hypothetical protein